MVHHSGPGQAVSPRRNVTGLGRPDARSARRNSRSSLRPLSIRDTNEARATAARPVSPAEAAQARLFEKILYPELLQLQRRLDLVAGDRRLRGEADELTGRVAELHRLLSAMGARFGEPVKPAFLVRRDRCMPSTASRN